MLVGLVHKLVHFAEGGAHALLGHVEQHLLRFLDHLVHIVGSVVGQRVNLRRGIDQLAEDGLALDEIDMALPACQRERVISQFGKIRTTPHSVQLTLSLKRIGKGDGIDGNATVHQPLDCLEDNTMCRAEEVLRLDAHDRFLSHLVVQQTRRQHRLLCLDVLGKLRLRSERCGLGVRLVGGGKWHGVVPSLDVSYIVTLLSTSARGEVFHEKQNRMVRHPSPHLPLPFLS